MDILIKDELFEDTIDRAAEDAYVFPSSYAQRRLWFLDQFEPGSPFYNIPSAIRLYGALDIGILERAFNEIVQRHESLRTVFISDNGEPMQVIYPQMLMDLPVIDLRGLDEDKREAEARRLVDEEARQTFNLAAGPLLRGQLLQLGDEEYIAAITMHHIVPDGWPMAVLVQELAILYDAFASGRSSPLPELEIQYADYAEWQRDWLQGEVLQNQVEFWKQELAYIPPVLQLPTDYPRPAVISSRGASLSFRFPKVLTDAVKAIARKESTTPFMSFLAAFQSLLHRYSGQDTITVGTPVANRTQAETEPLIGFFVNTLVMRADLSDNPSFRQLLRRVRETALGAYAHQDLPFEILVEALQPRRDTSHTPLFQVMFILQNAPGRAQEVPSLRLEQIEVDAGTSTYDITLSMTEQNQWMGVDVEYSTDLFDESTIRRMMAHFQTLLDGIVAEPDAPVAVVPLLTETERKAVAVWNDTDVDIPDDLCVHQLFELQVERTPDATAVVLPAEAAHDGRRQALSYGVLNERANQVAHYLQKEGVGPETLVGLCVERSLEMVIGLLGILKAGAAYVPLDPSYPPDRLIYMLDDAGVSLLVTQTGVVSRLPELQRFGCIYLDADADDIEKEATGNPSSAVCSDNLAYVIYTSGSTGQPKGVMVPHSAMINHNLAMIDQFELGPEDRMLQFATISFDAAVEEIFCTWLSGATLVLRFGGVLIGGAELLHLIHQEQLTVLDLPTAYWHELVYDLSLLGVSLPPSLRLTILGGQKASGERLAVWLRMSEAGQTWINTYGPTETAVVATAYRPDDSLDTWNPRRDPPIGRPITNVQAHLLDRLGQPVPVGLTGELHLGGIAVTRGYLNRPALTAEKFIPDPFSTIPGARLYNTGDQARNLPDGNIEFLGRADHQVKIRGFRVELGEIEEVLNQNSGVRQAVVEALDAPHGERQLVAYVALASEDALDAGELRAFVSSKLPEYMTPAAFIALGELPLTPSGKVDRRKLPEPDWSQPQAERTFIAPRTPLEGILAAIWSQVLGIDKVSVTDNFFDLGGHSLLATQLIARISRELEIDLPVRTIFESPALGAQALALEIAQRATNSIQAPPMTPVPRDEELPLSFAQQRLWFLDQLQPDSPFYNIPQSVRITGPLDLPLLERSLNAVIQRHESLRTTFVTRDNQTFQHIEPELFVPLVVQDISHIDDSEIEQEVERLAFLEAQRPFDLSMGPLMRAGLLRLSPQDHVILFTLHHIVSDDWSSNILFSEVAINYAALQRGEQAPLPTLPIQYADYAYWQRLWLQGETLDRELDYWREQLADAPPLLQLPTDRPRPAVQTFVGDYVTFTLPDEESQALQEICRREGVTMFMAMLAAFQTLLYRYSGQNDISIGTPVANRSHPATQDMIGFFLNTLVLRSKLFDDAGFRQLLHQVRETALNAYAHQEVPFEMVVEAVQPERHLSQSPLFQVMFTLQNLKSEPQDVSDIRMIPIEAHSRTAKFDLTMFMQEENGRLSGALEYNTDMFDRTTIDRMVVHFENLLTAMVADPEQPISTLQILAAGERQQLLWEWNETNAPFPEYICVHQLVEAQVSRTPDAIAVAFEETSITYAELNRRANQLAHYLHSFGVGPDVMVGVCAERTPDLVVGLLGILKAGGAYVPIDPAYPQERIAFMVEDAGVTVLLTQEALVSLLPESVRRQDTHRTILLDTDWPEIENWPDHNFDIWVSPQHLAYVIYTSGSTGLPKGTMVHHRGVSNYLTWCQQAYPVFAGQGSPVHSSISFDLTVTSMFSPLVSGGKVQLVPETSGIEGLGEVLLEEGDFSLVKITPAHLELLSQQITSDQAPARTHSFIIGGENLVAEHIDYWQEHAPDTLLVNEYGPTEAVVGCCVYMVRADEHFVGSVPIGRPIINTQLYILDRQWQPVPVGVAGELVIGGAGVVRGYLKRPALTAERFIPDPFSETLGARLYKTGDLARYLPDGTIQFLGRVDHQVNIRGYRVELGEVEATLSEHPAIEEVVALALPDRSGSSRLVVYYAYATESSAKASELRDFMQERVPDYMVPSVFIHLDVMPLNEHGKIDRDALPRPEPSRSDLGQRYEPPRNPTEALLVGIWSHLLDVDQIGIRDVFFELGGHSLLATQVISRIRDTFDVELPLRSVFESPTIAGLAARILEASGTPQTVGAPPLKPLARDGDLPLSFAQQRLWFLDQLDPNSSSYNLPTAIGLGGPLDVDAISAAWEEIIRRHESLRTSFASSEGVPSQIIAPPSRFELRIDDLSYLPEQDQQQTVERIAFDEAVQPFDLAIGPLFRARLLRLAETDHVLLFTLHHIISDGWSMGILVRELTALYHMLHLGLPSPLPDLGIQYADFAHWQRNWLQGEVLEVELAFWREQLQDSPVLLELPTDRPRPPVQTHNGDVLYFEVPSQVLAALHELGLREGATLFMTLLAAYQTLLFRYSGQDDVIVGTPVTNRNRSEIEGIIGFFVNTLVMRTDLSSEPSFAELLARVRHTTLDAYAHQHLPFEYLVDALGVERDMSHSPIFQTLFTLDTQPLPPDLPLGALTIRPINAKFSTIGFDLVLSMIKSGDTLSGSFEFNVDLFDKTTIERMVGHFQQLLVSVIAEPDRSITSLPWLSDEEINQIASWNDTAVDYPLDVPVLSRFETWAERQPDTVAVRYVGASIEHLTYGELNRRANQLGRYLIGLGIGTDRPVGICLERSPEMIIAMLGILKAGGAYMPIDPAYPADRQQFMIEDSGIKVLLTHSAVHAKLPEAIPLRLEGKIVSLDVDWDEISQLPDGGIDADIEPDQLAYIIYTSGSTGRPKGVMLHHQGLTNLMMAHTLGFGVSAADTVLQFASFSFDASVSETFVALCTGAELVLAAPERINSGAGILDLLREQHITVVTLPPSLLAVLDPDALPDLRVLVSAGEACSWEIVERWSEGRRFINGYGPTESTVGPTYCLVNDVGERPQTVPIGRPIANTQVHILDAAMEQVPVGVPGELYLGGVGIARGYLGRPDLTAERFTPDPFSHEDGSRLYRTGDLARYLPDGNIEFLGRVDHQVKLRGFRIELGEIEAVMERFPQVRNAAVVVQGAASDNARLGAYFVAEQGVEPSLAELRAFLQASLPDYMVPSAFLALEAFPLTASGKIDRLALPELEMSRSDIRQEYIAPRDLVEEQIVALWETLLDVRPIGVQDDFFALGGHSLLAVRMLALLEKVLDQSIPLVAIFQEPTVEGMARLVRQRSGAVPGTSLVPLQPKGEYIPLFFIHPSGGSVHWYVDLAGALAPHQPFYGLQAQGLFGMQELHTSVEDMTAHYVDLIRSTQPEGPYNLGSWSMGVIIAYEVAQQLRLQGQTVSHLILLDQGPFPPGKQPVDEAEYLVEFFGRALPLSVEALREMSPDKQLRSIYDMVREAGVIGPDIEFEHFQHMYNILKVHEDAWHRYVPKAYPGDAWLVKSDEQESDRDDLGWSELIAGNLTVVRVPGDHHGMLPPPHLQTFAEILMKIITT